MPQDTVLTPIEYIRIANVIFVERDELDDELTICKKINSISASLITTNDSIINKLESKIANLNLIIDHKDDIITLETDKLNAIIEKNRKQKIAIGGGAGVIILLLLLL